MILIVDNTKRKKRNDVRERLLRVPVPCALCVLDEMDAYLPTDAIIVTERYLLEDANYMAELRKSGPVYLCEDMGQIFVFALRLCRERYFDKYTSCRDITFRDKSVYYLSKRLKLTKAEIRIILFLLCCDEYALPELIGAYCLKNTRTDPSAISVHICNINKKAKRLTGENIIEGKRFLGYRINIPEISIDNILKSFQIV